MTILLTLLIYFITKAQGFYPPLPAPYYHPPQYSQYPHIAQSHDLHSCGTGFDYYAPLKACKSLCTSAVYDDKNQSCHPCQLKNSDIIQVDPTSHSDRFFLAPVPGSSNLFYCYGNDATYKVQCWKGYRYDKDQEACVPNWIYNYKNFQKEVGVSHTPLCIKEGTFSLPQPNGDCRHFYTCKRNIDDAKIWDQTIYQCAEQRRFNPTTKCCSYLSQCSYDAECADYDIRCPDTGVFRHPLDCSTFYYCTFDAFQGCFVARKYSCYGDTIYDVCKRGCKPISDISDCKYLPLQFQKELYCENKLKEYCGLQRTSTTIVDEPTSKSTINTQTIQSTTTKVQTDDEIQSILDLKAVRDETSIISDSSTTMEVQTTTEISSTTTEVQPSTEISSTTTEVQPSTEISSTTTEVQTTTEISSTTADVQTSSEISSSTTVVLTTTEVLPTTTEIQPATEIPPTTREVQTSLAASFTPTEVQTSTKTPSTTTEIDTTTEVLVTTTEDLTTTETPSTTTKVETSTDIPSRTTEVQTTTEILTTTEDQTTTEISPTTEVQPSTEIPSTAMRVKASFEIPFTTTKVQTTTDILTTTEDQTTTNISPTTEVPTTTDILPTTEVQTTTEFLSTTTVVETTTEVIITTTEVQTTTDILTTTEDQTTTEISPTTEVQPSTEIPSSAMRVKASFEIPFTTTKVETTTNILTTTTEVPTTTEVLITTTEVQTTTDISPTTEVPTTTEILPTTEVPTTTDFLSTTTVVETTTEALITTTEDQENETSTSITLGSIVDDHKRGTQEGEVSTPRSTSTSQFRSSQGFWPQSTSTEKIRSESLVKSSIEGSTSICSSNTGDATLRCFANLQHSSKHTCLNKNGTEAVEISVVNCTNCVENNKETMLLNLKIQSPPPGGSLLIQIKNINATSCVSS